MEDQLLTVRETMELARIGRSTIYKIALGEFPPGRSRHGRRLWWRSEILTYLNTDRVSTCPALPVPKPKRARLAIHRKATIKKS